MNLRLLPYVFVISFLAAFSNVSSASELSSPAGSWQLDGVFGDGRYGHASDIALDSTGSPVVVWEKETVTVTPSAVQVSDETNGVWALLPDLARDPNRDALMPSVAIRTDNRPVVAYVESHLENHQRYSNLYLRRWNGTAWVHASPSLNARRGSPVSSPLIALDKTGTIPTNYPTIAWTEWNGTNDDARVIRRTATGWQRLGTLNLSSSDSAWFGTSSLQLDKNGQPVVAWANRSGNEVIGLYVKKWNGTGWESYDVDQAALNNTNKGLKSFALALDKNDRPVIAWVENQLINQTRFRYHSMVLKIKRWNGMRWASVLNESYSHPYDASVRDSLSLAIDSLNQPVIAYTRWHGSIDLLRVKVRDRTTGTWVFYGEVLNCQNHFCHAGLYPKLVLQGGTIPVVLYGYSDDYGIAVQKWVP